MEFIKRLCLIFLIVSAAGCTQKEQYFRIEGYAQGGRYHIIYSDRNRLTGKKIDGTEQDIKALSDAWLMKIDNSLSGHNPHSLLSRVNRNETDRVDSLFADLFRRSVEIWKDTEGSFDISAAPLFDFWGFGFTKGNDYPEEVVKNKIDSIMQFTGMDKVRMEGLKVIKDDPRIKLNFNAIAQGYTCDILARALEERGISDYLIEIGGEICCKGRNSKGGPWRIGIDSPEDGNMSPGAKLNNIMEITDAGVVTSGNYRKFYIKDGKKFSHSIDPKTGYPVSHNLLSATLIMDNATDADAYATYCMVKGVEFAARWLEAHPEIKGYLIYGDNESMSTYFSPSLSEQLKDR